MILPGHQALDKAREAAAGESSIGTMWRGIGPAYEDKVARRAVRVADLLSPESLLEKLEKVAESRNFELTEYHGAEAVDVAELHAKATEWGQRLEPYVDHTGRILDRALRAGKSVLFEGARGHSWTSTTAPIPS